MFQDILPVLANPVAFEAVIADLVSHITSSKTLPLPDVIVGLDARGFLFGPSLSTRLGCSFVAVRKKGKLPGECLSASYAKEYGLDEFEMQKGSIKPGQKVYIVDDLIATGGSAKAAYDLVKQCGGEVVEFLFLVDLVDVGGSKNLPAPNYSILKVAD
jgi:adenine phosphoribosyltransferase